MAFTPWTTLGDYLDMLAFIEEHGLIDHVDPVQYTIRLLVPPGSYLLNRPEMKPHLGPLDQASFSYRWAHPDPRMDRLQKEVSALVEKDVHARRGPGDDVLPGLVAGRRAGSRRRGAGAAAGPRAGAALERTVVLLSGADRGSVGPSAEQQGQGDVADGVMSQVP